MLKWHFHLWDLYAHKVKCSNADLHLIAFATCFAKGLKSAWRLLHLFNNEVTVLFRGKSVLEIFTFLYLFYCHSENENVSKQVIHEIPYIGVITLRPLNLHIWIVHSSDIWLDWAQMSMISLSSLENRVYYCSINVEYVSV